MEELRAKIIEVVPEIRELYEWCGYGTGVSAPDHKWRDCKNCTKGTRDITLADVLRAVQGVNPEVSLVTATSAGTAEFAYWNGDTYPDATIKTTRIHWNLALPLDEQGPEVIAFLSSLLLV